MSEFRPKKLGENSRLFLLLVSQINLILGALFFVYPNLVINLWPWPVKPLAVRFIGAIFLAITLGCWSSLRAGGWQRAKVLPLVGSAFFGITALVTFSWGFSPSPGPTVWIWGGYFLLASIGLLALIAKHGWYREPRDLIASRPSWRLASSFFRVQTVVVGVFGTMMIILPDVAQEEFWPWRVQAPTLQTFGALFLATCLATGWASRQADIGRIRALLPLDAIFPTLALLAVALHWDVVSAESPSAIVTGVWVFLYSFVAVGSTYLFFTSARRKAAVT
ncbi:MAG: hypothetical protein AUF79_19750 [Crenarchaeota archaeon 13_1_20CM_2_51_8]|nr:MAG: hypothetical protein AUJ07_01305 [Crenarchaeota archaeon 13_1_40CM_3_53_5]OLE82441.1 MAG: hypothetical protein AUF79_19750 [Crenarchaeota archaeon 13_1_20CM_2_51_8]